ncbi:MAG: ribonuclease Z [Betaproteobacteria bacterium RIFCSPLOWO2_12_FULL_62_13]|nr:MAG: ribonuclease Z [Betaproteobacteria bacterium RIFCSPLOWO2_12_FULL_62_13]
MRPIFNPQLVNGPFGDPGLYLDFRFEKRALLFDLGDLAALPPKKLLRVSDVFVSHTHMDHFAGFDRLLRVCLGRETGVRLYGPAGFIGQVEHKLAAYTWNLVENYPADFVIEAWESDPDWRSRGARFCCHRRFQRESLEDRAARDGVLLDEPAFLVRAAFLDHSTACLGFAVEEKTHVNVWKNSLAELGLPVGPWLKELKQAVIQGAPGGTPVRVWWRDREGAHERTFPLAELKARVLRLVPGEKLCYVTDAVYHEDNARRIAALAAGADRLFIECVFLDEDADHAARKFHLTARQAGNIACAARAKLVVPFHFSPRYAERETELRDELEAARKTER